MSVINKVLRDLDQRQVKRTGVGGKSQDLRGGTVSVGAARAHPPSPQRRGRLIFGAMLLLVVGVSVLDAWPSMSVWPVLWRRLMHTPTAPEQLAPPVAVLAPPAATVVPAPIPALVQVPTPLPAPATAPATELAAAQPMPKPTLAQPQLQSQAQPAPQAGAPRTASAPPTLAPTLRMSTLLDTRKLGQMASEELPPPHAARPAHSESGLPTMGAAATSGSVASNAGVPAGSEIVAQAQQLWNSGSHDAGVELLQQAIARSQRADAASAPALHTLLREWVRLQLADARLAAVWEQLVRQDAQLREASDLWAIRAHAAQRLGHYQDSVYAYEHALQQKPTEQRWLLGAAVSSAALGKTANAADYAARARAVGPVANDIQQYLRQMGVALESK